MRFLSVLVVFFHLVKAYDKEAAAFWGQDCAFGCKECPNDSTCGATYFTTHALTHGNWGYGYQNDCPTLWYNFKNGKYDGWVFAGTSERDIYRGDVVIMNNGRGGDASHCCIGTGNGLISCHGPGNQNVPPLITGFFGNFINAVYTYVGTTNILNTTQIKSSICTECTSNVCSILPESGSTFPCYQGTPENTNLCYKTDPLIKTNTYVCNTCASQGYGNYIQNDPVYINMELWSKKNTMSSNIYGDTIISCSPYDADACNCVYYARDRQKNLPSGLTTCDDKKSKVNSHTPAPGCVLFRTGDPTYCHAAYVTKVANGNVYYDQANWTPCKCSSDYLSTGSSAILGYWCP
jgi:hypothetical protein